MASNRFIETIREKVKYPNRDGQFGRWDILNREQRKFLIECADYMEVLENRLEEIEYRQIRERRGTHEL